MRLLVLLRSLTPLGWLAAFLALTGAHHTPDVEAA